MNKFKKITVITLVVVMTLSSLTGCAKVFKADATKLPLVSELSEKEVIDYYARALSYDSVVSRNLDVDKVLYETIDVEDPIKLKKLTELQKKTESALANMTYNYSEELAEVLDENTFHYIKAMVNDKKLTNPNILSVKEAIGHYFIDVEYDVSNRSIGSFTNKISLLGINGAFVKDYRGIDNIDNSFLRKAVGDLNKYYTNNRMPNRATYNESSGLLAITGSNEYVPLDYTNTTINEPVVTNEADEIVDSTDEQEVDTGEENGVESNEQVEQEEQQEETEQDVDANQNISTIINNRNPKIDLGEFNRIVGSSTRETAYMPKLDIVYNIPAVEGTIGGIGAYPSGANGLARYQFNRGQISGKITLRFVYKDDVNNPNKTVGINVYPVSMILDSGIGNLNADNAGALLIPEFLQTEFEKLIERSDRAVVNKDMSALMSGKLYTDSGMAVLRGYEGNYVNVLRQMTSFRRLITRDTKNNSYVVEIERLRQEGPKGADVYGTYIDTGYMVIEQKGNEFVITDEYIILREMQTEPDINPDSAITKRLVALNLAGPVSEDNKTEISNLMDELYLASTNRLLYGPKEVDGVLIEKGMYDCFNDDVTMLPSTRKEYINSELREQLVKHGVNVNATVLGKVTSWIGGADKQAEFITEEVITYQGRNTGMRFEVYYLVSSMEDKWVIDERAIINSEEQSGEALNNTIDRLTK